MKMLKGRKMTKVVKLPLICEQTDENGNSVDYKDVYRILWDLQKQTREIKNKTIQYCWEYSGFSSDYYKEYHKYPDNNEILSKKTLFGYINSKLKDDYDLYSGNLSTTIKETCKAFNNAKKDIYLGDKSILSYKSNQPLDIHDKCVILTYAESTYYVSLCLMNKGMVKQNNFKDSKIIFIILVKDKSTKTILDRCLDKAYKVCASKLIYNQKKKLWTLNLVYTFENAPAQNLEPD